MSRRWASISCGSEVPINLAVSLVRRCAGFANDLHVLAFLFGLSQFLEFAFGKFNDRKVPLTNFTSHAVLHLVFL